MLTELLALVAVGQIPTPDAPVAAEPRALRLPMFGLNVGSYIPTSSLARNRFGDNWLAFSPGFGPVLPRPVAGLQPDLSFATQKRQTGLLNNRAFLALVGVQYQWPLFRITEETTKLPLFLPYAGVGAGAAYATLRSEGDGVNGSSLGGNVNAYVGTSIGLNGFVEARYRALSRLRSFDLSGAELSLGIRF